MKNAQEKNFDRDVGFALHDVARLLRRNFDRQVKALGLSQAQWKVLVHLSRAEGMHQRELAYILEIQPMSVAKQVARMESAGWLKRVPDSTDKRAINLYLSSKAKSILEQMRGMGKQVFTQAFLGISPKDQQNLFDILVKIRKNLCEP